MGVSQLANDDKNHNPRKGTERKTPTSDGVGDLFYNL